MVSAVAKVNKKGHILLLIKSYYQAIVIKTYYQVTVIKSVLLYQNWFDPWKRTD